MLICYREINWKNALHYTVLMYILWYNNTSVCGLVFFLEKDGPEITCNDSNANCNNKEDKNQIYKDETKCNTVNEVYREKCNIELTTQVYTSYYRGKYFLYIHMDNGLSQIHISSHKFFKHSILYSVFNVYIYIQLIHIFALSHFRSNFHGKFYKILGHTN